MATRYASKDDLLDMKKSFDTAFHAYVRYSLPPRR